MSNVQRLTSRGALLVRPEELFREVKEVREGLGELELPYTHYTHYTPYTP